VIYVWIDALTNYISALGYLDTPEKFRRYWPADIHLVGKEIARFHAVYWPILLHAAGIEVPRQTFAHGWLTFGGQRFSKSLGVVIDPAALSREVASESGAEVGVAVDALRYFLLREIPFGTDGDFNKPALLHRFNADLANDYGNLLNRTLPQLKRQFGGQVPARGPAAGQDGALQQVAREVVAALEPRIDRLDFKGALEQIWRLLGTANKYIDEEAPWQTVRTDPARAGTVLYNTLEAVRIATILLTPWLPTATARVWDQLGITVPLANQRLADAARWGGLPSGTQVRPGAPIFPRIETKVAAAVRSEQSKAALAGAATGGEQTVSTISIDEFKKIDIRVGEIRSATRVPGTDKLIQVQVDLGSEVRTVVAGLVPQYQPDDLVGKRVIVVANLEPRRMRGIASQGMLLAAEWDGQVALLTVEKNAPQGAKIS
jgi:methionyl-tRNA synthetase